jgi:type IV pilus assembly protein PilQ
MKKGFFLIYIVLLTYTSFSFSQEIQNVSFVQEGEISKLVIEMDQENIFSERFHVSEDKQIILDLKNVKSSSKHLRGIDTSEFPGSTVFISGYRKPGTTNDIRFAIQLRDNVRSVLEIIGKKIILNIENRFGVFTKSKFKKSDDSVNAKESTLDDVVKMNIPKSNQIEDILYNLTLSGPKKYIGKRISLNVRSIPVTEILNMIADTSGFNIIIDQGVSSVPPLTITLANIPWDQALDTVMTLSKLVAQKSSNILIIKTLDMVTKEKEAELAVEKLKLNLEPLVTRIFLINYATLGDISKIVKDYISPQRGSIQTDDRTNSLIVKDTLEAIERIKKIIETLDTQTPQIMIESKIVEANETFSKNLGLRNGLQFGYDPIARISDPRGPGWVFSTTGNYIPGTITGDVGGGAGGAGGAGGTGGAGGVSQPPLPLAGSAMGFSIGVFRRILNLEFALEMAETENRTKIISSPKIVTQNKKPATLTSSEQTSYLVQQPATGNAPPIQTYQTIAANTNLTVTPHVTNDGSISMDISVQKADFGRTPSGGGPPNMNRRNIKTNVLVDNGSTIVIGGIYRTSSSDAVSGVPYLRNLPLIGWLFRTPERKTNSRNELIIFITPRILNAEQSGFSETQASRPEQAKKEI